MVDLHSLAEDGTEEMEILRSLDFSRLPRHIAIIMDGNGRWAGRRHLPRVAGHRAGIASVRDVVEASARLGLEAITLYAFSKENWKRPRAEIETLMGLLREYLRKELETLQRNAIRFRVIGNVEELGPAVGEELARAMAATASNTGLLFNIALSYGGRAEIVEACRRILARAAEGTLDPATLDETAFAGFLYTAGTPDPDLLIRTSGELRVSNFLLWQIAYAEIWVTDTLWPDFRRRELFRAIADYQKRNRRYGGIGQENGGRSDPAEGGVRGTLVNP
jgi:undecaprenyl diphosphate synthase